MRARHADRTRSQVWRYVLWQAPGWLLGGLVLALVTALLDLPGWIVPAGIAVLAARDLALYPVMRALFRSPSPPQPIGARGIAVDALEPSGYVRVNGELWRAETPERAVSAGSQVVVRGARGLTLIVERADEGARVVT